MDKVFQSLALRLFMAACILGALAQDSLEGCTYACGGIGRQFAPATPIYNFDANGKIQCPDAHFLSNTECGTYNYDAAADTLTGNVLGVDFATTDHFVVDGILVSFQTVGYDIPCNIIALDWKKYAGVNTASLFLQCPVQNPIPLETASISYEQNSWSFYETGGGGYTSMLEQVKADNTIRRDGFGVYVWDSSTERMRIYFGAWQSRHRGYVDATFTRDAKLLVDGALPVGGYCYASSGTLNAVVHSKGGTPSPGSPVGGSNSDLGDGENNANGMTTSTSSRTSDGNNATGWADNWMFAFLIALCVAGGV